MGTDQRTKLVKLVVQGRRAEHVAPPDDQFLCVRKNPPSGGMRTVALRSCPQMSAGCESNRLGGDEMKSGGSACRG